MSQVRANSAKESAGWAGTISVREVLRLMWEADRHPILGNHDRHEAEALDKKVRTLAAEAVSSPDDPAEFVGWLAALRNPELSNGQRERILGTLYDLFDPQPLKG